MTSGGSHIGDSRFLGGWHECPVEGCQTSAMDTDDTDKDLMDQGITGGTTAVFTMKQAAEVAGISVSTLRRRRNNLIAAGADISPDGWKVPMTALVACGLITGEGPEAASRSASVTPRTEEGYEASGQSRQLDELTAQVRELNREVNEWRRRAEVAEARAEERRRALDALQIANETERMALRMLTGQSTHTPQAPMAPEPAHRAPTAEPEASPGPTAPATPQEPRRGFFSRIFSA
ncbi:MAG: hypothetical protein CMJ89_05820 [Planctomycetes bacterium]|nr:hypothetical protein [Planctomycetota bacterium]